MPAAIMSLLGTLGHIGGGVWGATAIYDAIKRLAGGGEQGPPPVQGYGDDERQLMEMLRRRQERELMMRR